MQIKIIHPRIVHTWKEKSGSEFPSFWDRINDNIKLGRPCLIVIDGKSQTGKSTLARYICSNYDNNYKTFFTIDDLLRNLQMLKTKLEYRVWLNSTFEVQTKFMLPEYMTNKWDFFDEPQLEAGKQEGYWNIRNKILVSYSSGFGFLKHNLVMALPNIKGLSDIVLTNITFRISVISFLSKYDGSIVRMAFVKIPFYREKSNKYGWITVEQFTIPKIADDLVYDSRKTSNFFDTQLNKWQSELGLLSKTQKNYEGSIDKRTGRITYTAKNI